MGVVEKKVRLAAKRDVAHTGRYLMMTRLTALEEQGQKGYDGIPGIAWLEV